MPEHNEQQKCLLCETACSGSDEPKKELDDCLKPFGVKAKELCAVCQDFFQKQITLWQKVPIEKDLANTCFKCDCRTPDIACTHVLSQNAQALIEALCLKPEELCFACKGNFEKIAGKITGQGDNTVECVALSTFMNAGTEHERIRG